MTTTELAVLEQSANGIPVTFGAIHRPKVGPIKKLSSRGFKWSREGISSRRLCPQCDKDVHSFKYKPPDLDVFGRISFSVKGQELTPKSWVRGYKTDRCAYLAYLCEAKSQERGDDEDESGKDSAQEEFRQIDAARSLDTARSGVRVIPGGYCSPSDSDPSEYESETDPIKLWTSQVPHLCQAPNTSLTKLWISESPSLAPNMSLTLKLRISQFSQWSYRNQYLTLLPPQTPPH